MRMPKRVIEAGAWMLENGHRALLALTGGRFPRTVMGMAPVELHAVGRSSGQRRSTMLTAPILEPDRVVLVASKGGHPDHPDWYKNLVANPDVTVEVGDQKYAARAVVVTGPERDELFERQMKEAEQFRTYQMNTTRVIPVVELVRA